MTNLLPTNPNVHSTIEDDYVLVMKLFEVFGDKMYDIML